MLIEQVENQKVKIFWKCKIIQFFQKKNIATTKTLIEPAAGETKTAMEVDKSKVEVDGEKSKARVDDEKATAELDIENDVEGD